VIGLTPSRLGLILGWVRVGKVSVRLEISWLVGNQSMTNITVQLPDGLLEQVQSLAGHENLQEFLISAIEHEVERQQPSATASAFWDNLQKLRDEMQTEGIEIDPDEIWGNLRDRSVGREISL
jgi:hypothetical protein